MSDLRAELAQQFPLEWQDGRLPEVDLQAATRGMSLAATSLGRLWSVPGFCNFRFCDQALWRAVQYWLGCSPPAPDNPPPPPGDPGNDLSRRVEHLDLLVRKLAPETLPDPLALSPTTRRLAVGLERLWSTHSLNQTSRFKRILAEYLRCFHEAYENCRVSNSQELVQLQRLGQALRNAGQAGSPGEAKE